MRVLARSLPLPLDVPIQLEFLQEEINVLFANTNTIEVWL